MKKIIISVLIISGAGVATLLIQRFGMQTSDDGSAMIESAQKTASLSNDSSLSADKTAVALRPKVERPVFIPEECPIRLRSVFGLDGPAGYLQRKRIVQSLGKDLLPNEINALHAYLYFNPEAVGLDQNGYDGLGDVIMLKLEEQVILPPDYADHLVWVYYDTSRHDNWRDYCVQHLGTTYARTAPGKQSVIRQLFMDAIEQDSEMAGTALLAMKNAGLDEGLIAEQAMKVASNPVAPDSSRLSAIHLAADTNHPEALPLARKVVESKQTVHFRMAAMAVIGKLGNSSDLPMLNKYINSSDIRLRESSKAALRRVLDRQNNLVAE